MNKHFWNWARDETNPEERTLLLEGPIAEESWYGDEVTPAAFREELFSADGPIVISVNSPGGDTIAASQIYTMLREYPGNVTVKITGIAASAASVIAMAGTKVCMSPTAMMMIHNPFTIAMGDSEEMRRAALLVRHMRLQGHDQSFESKGQAISVPLYFVPHEPVQAGYPRQEGGLRLHRRRKRICMDERRSGYAGCNRYGQ